MLKGVAEDGIVSVGDAISKKVKDSLIVAERAWLKWRDAEAAFRAYRDAVRGFISKT
jgi:hypothetical protein